MPAFALALLLIVLPPSTAAVARPPEPPEQIKPSLAVVLEDQGKIIVQHGLNCGVSDKKDGKQTEISFKEKVIIPAYADTGTVILNGWFAEYLYGDEHVRSLSSGIGNINVSGNALTWTAGGRLEDDDLDNPYRWCYAYTTLAWNSKLIDAIPETEPGPNTVDNFIFSSEYNFPSENTALMTLEPYIRSAAFVGKQAIAVLPKGFKFRWNNESRILPWACFDCAVDHQLLQIAYNLDHTELLIPKGKDNLAAATYDQGAVSWVTHGILKDDAAKRDVGFFESVSALGGNDIGIIHPPFAIRPKQISGAAIMGTAHGVTTERVTIEGIPFEYAVPVLTGWDLHYDGKSGWFGGGDRDVRKLGIWLHDVSYGKKPGAATGALSYSVSAVLADDNPQLYTARHRATILGLVKTGAPAADLVPVPSDAPDNCRRDNDGRLLITIKNQGSLDAGPSLTTVFFANGTYSDVATPAIAAGATTALQPVLVPGSCFTPNCQFRVTVDSKQQVKESNESNNVAEGQCKG